MQIRHLSVHTPKRELIRNLTIDMHPGECWCLIGRNGAGKSTLLKTLAGIRDIKTGDVLLEGKRLQDWSLRELASRRAYLAQSRTDAFGYTALETVLSARHPYHDAHYWDQDSDVQQAMLALAAMDVAALAERDVRSLSGGERQRVAIAALLAQDARWLLLDEPANALDLAHQVSAMSLLARLCKEQQKGVLMVSHDLNLAARVATHALLLMGDGSWIAGPADEVLRADLLSTCLGHPVSAIPHEGLTVFIPQALPA